MPRLPSRFLPTRLRGACLLTVAALGLGATAARAETLSQLYDAARAYDATYLSARALADAAEFKAAQADALLRPSARLNGSASQVLNNGVLGNTVNGRTATVGLQGSQSLFNKANDATVAQARRALEISKADLETAEQDLVVRVAQAYFDVLGAQDTLAAAQAFKKAVAEQLASAKRNFEVGTATITDSREAQARYDLATARELVADNDLRTKRTVLDQLVGRNGVAPQGLALPVALPPVLPADMDAWVRTAEDSHPAIRKAQLGQLVAQLETEKARAAALPTVDLTGSVGTTRNAGSAYVPNASRGTITAGSVGVQVNMTLFSGGLIENRVKETVVLEEKARQDLEAARRGVGLGTRSAYLGVQSLLGQVKALEAAEASTKLALDATELGYKVGVRVNLDVLNAQSQLYDTRRDLAKARYDVLVNRLKLRQAAGQLRAQDLRGVDALLAP
ncbi:MAG TPA: TolC family outer membrane protein [Aquabacterium sp.]|mgnify:CR=1 FL=1|nr:TolC family outer membrane protein [Aquabacterium sp.]